jgi:isocitrate dehydrogenase (NAD+)
VAPGANIGHEIALFEPVHGSAPKYAGQNKVNPTATILSGALLLRHLGEAEAADRVEAAVRTVIAEGRSVTYDLKRTRDDPTAVGTQEMADAIVAAM